MSLTAALRDLNKLNTFVRVGERLSFTKAAADLRTTPSVVSKHMKELEAALGFSLLNRSTHGIVLTDAGDGLFQSCLQMLSKLDGYVVEARNLQKGPVGTLRVQAPSDYARCVLAPVISEFAGRHPGLRIHLFVATDNAVRWTMDLMSSSPARNRRCPALSIATSARCRTLSARRRPISNASAGRKSRRSCASTIVS